LITLNADLKTASALSSTLLTEFNDTQGELTFIGAKEIDSTTTAGQNTLAREDELNKLITGLAIDLSSAQ
jgi:hypothetical protein